MQLDEAQLNALKPSERARYMSLEQLFSQPGWKVVVALAKQNAEEQRNRAAFANSWADNRLAIGNSAAWNAIAQLEEQTEQHYARLVSESEREIEIVKINEEGDFE